MPLWASYLTSLCLWYFCQAYTAATRRDTAAFWRAKTGKVPGTWQLCKAGLLPLASCKTGVPSMLGLCLLPETKAWEWPSHSSCPKGPACPTALTPTHLQTLHKPRPGRSSLCPASASALHETKAATSGAKLQDWMRSTTQGRVRLLGLRP